MGGYLLFHVIDISDFLQSFFWKTEVDEEKSNVLLEMQESRVKIDIETAAAHYAIGSSTL